MAQLEELSQALMDGDADKVKEGVQKAIAEGMEPGKILNRGLLSGMEVIGRKFKNGEIFVPEVLISARAMKSGMEILKPRLVESGAKARGTVVLGTVSGDLHDIGKNLVRMMLEGADFEVIDLGTDVDAEEFVGAVRDNSPDVLGLSALLTTTMPEMKNVLEVLTEEGLRDKVKVMVGGAPVTEDFADKIGADGYAKNAAAAADLTGNLNK